MEELLGPKEPSIPPCWKKQQRLGVPVSRRLLLIERGVLDCKDLYYCLFYGRLSCRDFGVRLTTSLVGMAALVKGGFLRCFPAEADPETRIQVQEAYL